MYEWSGLRRGPAMGLITGRDPRTHPWGVFSRDASMAPMVGAGTFAWFASLEEAAAFVAELVPTLLLDPDQHGYAERDAATRDVAVRVARGETAPARAAGELSAIWAGAAAFEWWGTLDELAGGQDPFPIRLRTEFFAEERAEDERPVQGADLDDFVRFVREYA